MSLDIAPFIRRKWVQALCKQKFPSLYWFIPCLRKQSRYKVSINACHFSQNEEVFFFSRESLLITHCKCMYTCVSHHYNGEKRIDSVTSVVFVQLNKDSCNYLNKAQTNKFIHKYYRIQKKSLKKLFLFEIQLITFFFKKNYYLFKKKLTWHIQ